MTDTFAFQPTELAWGKAQTALERAYASWDNLGAAGREVTEALDTLVSTWLGYGEVEPADG